KFSRLEVARKPHTCFTTWFCQPETQQAASGNDKNIQKSTVTGPTQTKQTREQPSTSANTGKQTPLPMSGTTQEATKLPGDSVVAARSGTKAKPVSKESEDAAPKGLKGIIGTIIEGIYKLTIPPCPKIPDASDTSSCVLCSGQVKYRGCLKVPKTRVNPVWSPQSHHARLLPCRKLP
ncbi:hypothetical protein ACJJTC_015213, partial [Scirpophaga incertulas]